MLVLVAYAAHVCAPLALLAQQSGKAAGGASEGKQIFATTCAACHGLDGAGGEHGPDIAHRREVQGLTDQRLQQIVRGGVPGTGMPAFRSLSETQVKAVVRYLRSLAGSRRNSQGFRRPQAWQGHFLWQGRLLAVSHGEGRGRLHRLGSFQLRQHALGRRHSQCDYRSQPEPRSSKAPCGGHHGGRSNPDRSRTQRRQLLFATSDHGRRASSVCQVRNCGASSISRVR